MKKNLAMVIALIAIAFKAQAQGTWTQKANFTGGERSFATGFSIGSKGYIGTGEDTQTGTRYNDFWEYDPVNNFWTQRADFGGTGRRGAIGFSIGSKGYIGTGIDNTYNYKNDFWEYDPSTNAWTQKANLGWTGVYAAVGFCIGTKGYVGTGQTSGFSNDFWEYDPSADTWAQKADFGGSGRIFAVGFSIGSKGYIGTGLDDTNNFKNDLWEYDPSTNAWLPKANFGGEGRYGATGFSIGTKGYVGTGVSDCCTFYKDFWEYDATTDAWTQKVNFEGELIAFAVGFANSSSGYIGTGYYSASALFWEYTPATNSSIVTNQTIDHACPGGSIDVSLTASGYNEDNIFTAQLSTASGSFTNPTNIGSLAATSSGTIEATIPSSTPFGQHYRIRVVASDPATTGTDNGNDITISCSIPKGLVVEKVAEKKAWLSWDKSSCDATFTLAFRKAGTNYWNKLNTSFNYMVLHGLMPSSVYYWKVRSVCVAGVYSPWSQKESFTTLALRGEDAGEETTESLNIYPNPTSGNFTIDLTLDDEETTDAQVQIVNMLGQIIFSENEKVESGRLLKEIQLSNGIAEGMYLVRVIINDQVFTSQINFQK